MGKGTQGAYRTPFSTTLGLVFCRERVHHPSCLGASDLSQMGSSFAESHCTHLESWGAPASSEVRCPCLGLAKTPEICSHSHTFAMSLLPWLYVVSSKQISLCGFPINTSQGELVNMDEAF